VKRISLSVLLCLLVGTSMAMVIDIPAGELDNQSALIVTGTVTGQSSNWSDDQSSIYTDVTIAVGQVDKGLADNSVVVRIPGGEVGEVGLGVEDVPVFMVGDQVRLHLAPAQGGVYTLVSYRQGAESAEDGKPLAYYKWSGYYRNPATCHYRINTAVPSDRASAVQAGTDTWNAAGSAFRFYYDGTTTASGTSYDGINAVSWGNLGSGGTIAQNAYWYNRKTKVVSESDITFNTYYGWTTVGAPNCFDVQNIATHEQGHYLVLDDLYQSYQSAMTMYGYGDYNQTYARTLEFGDIDGIKKIYGAGVFAPNPQVLPKSALE
jgi:hypothetical protein